jgi:hypothetical protein
MVRRDGSPLTRVGLVGHSEVVHERIEGHVKHGVVVFPELRVDIVHDDVMDRMRDQMLQQIADVPLAAVLRHARPIERERDRPTVSRIWPWTR